MLPTSLATLLFFLFLTPSSNTVSCCLEIFASGTAAAPMALFLLAATAPCVGFAHPEYPRQPLSRTCARTGHILPSFRPRATIHYFLCCWTTLLIYTGAIHHDAFLGAVGCDFFLHVHSRDHLYMWDWTCACAASACAVSMMLTAGFCSGLLALL